MRNLFFIGTLFLGMICFTNCVEKKPIKQSVLLAQTPPMGWNSFDAYDSRINEEEFKANADFLAAHLLKYGWEYATIDYVWYHPEPGNFKFPDLRFGHPNIRLDEKGFPIDKLVMDEFGRLLPATNRFPSAEGGKGFKPIGDYLHSKGLKFGIHIMRGIPRQAYFENLPIKGTNFTAQNIAEPFDTCSWCNHNFGIDASKPGAQEYYNSLFEMYAEWGVDLVKADDMMQPKYHNGDIELMRNAISKCGRPIVLSLSCGEAPISFASHLSKNAEMWRISTDFWDNWESLKHNFDLFEAWSPFIKPGNWPDGDMIPFGKISLNNRPHGPERQSGLTWTEHQTLMSLWCIARSPLIIGSDLLSMDEKTLSYFTNEEVLAVNQNSSNNRMIYREGYGVGDQIIWFADIPGSNDKYVALFNIGDQKSEVAFHFEFEELRDAYLVRDLWERKDIGIYSKELKLYVEEHGSRLFKLINVKDIKN